MHCMIDTLPADAGGFRAILTKMDDVGKISHVAEFTDPSSEIAVVMAHAAMVDRFGRPPERGHFRQNRGMQTFYLP